MSLELKKSRKKRDEGKVAIDIETSEEESLRKQRTKKGPGVVWSDILVLFMVALAIVTIAFSMKPAKGIMTILLNQDNSTRVFENAKDASMQAEQEFVDTRTFEVPYGNVEEVLSLLEGVSGITVNTVVAVDPKQGFAEVGSRSEIETYGAARITLTVADVVTALKSLDKAQLALNTIEVSGNTITIDVVLKGAEAW